MLLQHLVVIGARRYAMDDTIWEYSRQASVFQNVQQDGRGALHLRRHYTGGAFAGAVTAAVPSFAQ